MTTTQGPEAGRDIGEESGLALDRDTLGESISHDYSTADVGIVPLNRRRSMLHFAGIELTFEAGFSFLLLGFTVHDGGWSLGSTIVILLVSSVIYIAYAAVGAYLGSRTGQTHSLLTRSVFGVGGSWLVSILAAVALLGYVGFQANLTAQIWDGLYGWGHVELIGILLAGAMIINNVFGFSGVASFARYIVTPVFLLWIAYTVAKGLTQGSNILGATPKAVAPLTFAAAVGLAVGSFVWGNEPDIWRFGKPQFKFSIPPYIFAFVFGPILFGIGGWIMAEVSTARAFGPSIGAITHFSLFGALFLAFIISILGQFSINDGNYYAAINAVQNLLGSWGRWKRLYTCALVAMLGMLAAYLVPYVLTNAFGKLASFISVTLPCATVIMAVDHFLLPRLFGISRPLTKVPAWHETAKINWPAIVALLVSVGFGAYATGLLTFFGESSTVYIGEPAPEAWLLAALLYLAGVWIARALASSSGLAAVLGYPSFLRAHSPLGHQAVNLASEAESRE
jgi:purine-cytosine permease-like protein